MAGDKTREREVPSQPRTILDPLRPAVVVRRRVIETAVAPQDALRSFISPTNPPSRGFEGGAGDDAEDDDDFEDDNGPPSSVNVARALQSLRADELRRVEEIVEADDATPTPPLPLVVDVLASGPPVPTVPTILVGKEISLSELAKKMSMVPQELATTLVARGFYSMTSKTVLARETARDIAASFGWSIENAPEPAQSSDEPTESAPANSAVRSKKKSTTSSAKKSATAKKRSK